MAKKKKSADDLAPKGDHLKYYCVVFGILVVVIAVVAFQQKGTLEEYRKANVFAERLLTGRGMPEKTIEGRPNKIADLAIEVEKFVQGFKKSVGTQAGTEGISVKQMETAAFNVNMKQKSAGAENDEPNRGKGFRTRSRDFTYESATLEQLTTLAWNIEALGRYRVFEMRWKLADKKENSKPPYNLVNRPSIKVGYRQPLTRER
jgi:hypothetical protein